MKKKESQGDSDEIPADILAKMSGGFRSQERWRTIVRYLSFSRSIADHRYSHRETMRFNSQLPGAGSGLNQEFLAVATL